MESKRILFEDYIEDRFGEKFIRQNSEDPLSCTYPCTHTHIRTHIRIYTRTHTYAYTHAHTHTHTHAHETSTII